MSQEVVVALIGTVPGILMAVVALRTKPRPTGGGDDGHGAPPPHSRNPFHPRETPPTPLRIAVVLTAMAVVTAAVALGMLGLSRTGDDGGPTTKSVLVPATRTWTNTGLSVRPGDDVDVIASGEIFHSITQKLKCGPDGHRGNRTTSNVIANVDHGALIGMITSEGEPFAVGAHGSFTAPRAGLLFLGVNDEGVDNNSGQFAARVLVHRSDG